MILNKGYTYRFTVFPVKSNVLILKSNARVGKVSWKILSENLSNNDDFPTAKFPIRSNLNY